jgi:hypothetical protein
MNTDTRLIPLTQGKFSIVDACDYEWLMQWKWAARKQRTTRGFIWYALTHSKTEKKTVYLHREIARLSQPGFHKTARYDHRDRDGLNNTRGNIRPCTYSQQMANKTKMVGASSKYKGVSWWKSHQRWVAQIDVNKKRMRLGEFTNEVDASKAYEIAALKYFGEFACFARP